MSVLIASWARLRHARASASQPKGGQEGARDLRREGAVSGPADGGLED
ncbi:T-box transcription factor TBX1 (T-box protein 1) (Testis-specific T-box protein) (fragment) [Bradyrhizobium sp. ORS 375]